MREPRSRELPRCSPGRCLKQGRKQQKQRAKNEGYGRQDPAATRSALAHLNSTHLVIVDPGNVRPTRPTHTSGVYALAWTHQSSIDQSIDFDASTGVPPFLAPRPKDERNLGQVRPHKLNSDPRIFGYTKSVCASIQPAAQHSSRERRPVGKLHSHTFWILFFGSS